MYSVLSKFWNLQFNYTLNVSAAICLKKLLVFHVTTQRVFCATCAAVARRLIHCISTHHQRCCFLKFTFTLTFALGLETTITGELIFNILKIRHKHRASYLHFIDNPAQNSMRSHNRNPCGKS